MSDKVLKYEGKDADVTWDGRLCIHIGECGRASGDLFVGGRNPWCQPDATTHEDVVDVVDRCPTGALTYTNKDGSPGESADAKNVIVVANNGPLYLRGDLDIEAAVDDMAGVAFRAALCRCGQSKKKPFCDNSHEAAGFIDRGAIGKKGSGIDEEGGSLKVKGMKDGPLMVSGNVTLVTASGRVAWTGTKAALCRCGASKNKPFCDGRHKAVGFEAE